MSTTGVFVLLVTAAAQGLQAPRLVYPRLLEERSTDGKVVLHLHDELTLSLEGTSVAAPTMRVLTDEDGRSFKKFYDGEEINRNLYQDAEKMATVSLKARGKSVELVGVVGPSHRIEPLLTAERSEDGLVPHMIHEIEHNEMRDKVLAFTEENQRSHFSARAYSARPPLPPQNVTIEVFIVTDKPHHGHFNTTKELIVYLCITLNSVNIRFTEMTRPRVKLMLTGTERNEDERFVIGGKKYTHDSRTLKALKIYARDMKTIFGNPDVVFFFTGRDVVTDDDDGKLSTDGLGIAYLGGLCTENYVGLGEDRPGFFNGIFTLAHEMGHLLGAQHDGSRRMELIPGYVGSERCSWEDGYMMSYKDKGPNHHRFSECSLLQMRLVIQYRGKECWLVLSSGEEHVDYYPGNMLTPEEVCKNVFPNEKGVSAKMTFPKGDKECKLKCEYQKPRGLYTYTYWQMTDAPDYTPCGERKVCVRGLCEYDNRRKGHHTGKTVPTEPALTTKATPSTTRLPWYKWGWKRRHSANN